MSISDYEAHTVPVSDSEIKFLAEIFREILNEQRKEDSNETAE